MRIRTASRYLVIVTGIGIIFAPYIVKAIAWGWKIENQRKVPYGRHAYADDVSLPLFIGLAALAMGMLNSLRSFLYPALSPVMLNIMTIGSVFFLAPRMPEPIMGAAIAWCWAECASSHSASRPPEAGMMLKPQFSPSHPGVPRSEAAVPVLLQLLVTQLNIIHQHHPGVVSLPREPSPSCSTACGSSISRWGSSAWPSPLPCSRRCPARRRSRRWSNSAIRCPGLRLVFFIMFPPWQALSCSGSPL